MNKIYLIFIIVLFTSQCVVGKSDATPIIDSNTFSNYQEATVNSYHLDWTIDFESQIIDANITINFLSLTKITQVVLDVWKLKFPETINCIFSDSHIQNSPVNCIFKNISQEEGDSLTVDFSNLYKNGLAQGEQFSVQIGYQITNESKSMSWLTAQQTSTKVQPYFFTQNEPAYARSVMPIMDTPSIKSTWTAQIKASTKITNVYMSAVTLSKVQVGDYNVYTFEQTNPVPSYLLAIVAGNVIKKVVGDKCSVISEPDVSDLASKELSDLQNWIEKLSNYTQIKYSWPEYSIVIMPPSFPFGGMENPLLTFASPSILDLTGSKSGVNVAIHEIAHSWTGNTVTCGNWSNLWLNEGFTVFMERKVGQILFGDNYWKIEAINGNSTANHDYETFEKINQPTYTALNPQTKGANPDDSFSTVPYEKGFQFLVYIESLIGKQQMNELVKKWINNNAWKSAVWSDFQQHFVNFVNKNVENPQQIIDAVKFEEWINGKDVAPQQDKLYTIFYTPLVDQAKQLASNFIQMMGVAKPQGWQDLLKWDTNVKYIFLDEIYLQRDKYVQYLGSYKLFSLIDQCYNFSSYGNYEILWRWNRDVVYSGYLASRQPKIVQYVGSIGRIKMIAPIYEAFMEIGQKDFAVQLYKNNQAFYHPIARISIERIVYPKQNLQSNYKI